VTPIDDTTAPQEEVVAAIKDNPPQTHHESPSPESRGKAKIKKKSKKHKR
jgi:hypothetical protein